MLQSAIDVVDLWSESWGLPLSSEKTFYFHLGSSNTTHQYYLGGNSLEVKTFVRDLGFFYDDKLSFSDYCKIISKKAERRLFQMFKALYTTDPMPSSKYTNAM